MSVETWERMGRRRGSSGARSALSPGGWCLAPFYVGRRRGARPAHQADRSHLIAWAIHIPGAGLVLVWAVGVCAIPVEEYILLYAYPGLALTVLRSYCEHRAVPAVGERTGIVEAGPLMSLMYLNNNLHAVHHAKASLAWYKLPALYRERRTEFLAANGGYVFPGYWQIVGRYLIVPKEPTPHPFLGRPEPAKAA